MDIFRLEPKDTTAFKQIITFLYKFGVEYINITDVDDTSIKITGASKTKNSCVEIDLYKHMFIKSYVNNAVPFSVYVNYLHEALKPNTSVVSAYKKIAFTCHKDGYNRYLLSAHVLHQTEIAVSNFQILFSPEPIKIPTFILHNSYVGASINITQLKYICKICKSLGLVNIKITMSHDSIKFQSTDPNISYKEVINNIIIIYALHSEQKMSGTYDLNRLLTICEQKFNGDKSIYMCNDYPLLIVCTTDIGQIVSSICPITAIPNNDTIDKYIKIKSESGLDNDCECECEDELDNDYDYDNIEIQI
ncbi:MAG: hypothetical protein Homavirus16_8 [Homavirus sp.]|uniref:Uncharacterized protein n=1 Tax=Homavirus sp. TaxID=2487769 RepID=A0A3G5AA40_9VIRU|nr:MAG: hypothetical protein Homavirus16_8 [Homavirus sp.]